MSLPFHRRKLVMPEIKLAWQIINNRNNSGFSHPISPRTVVVFSQYH
ncbi:hypothetical protein BN135_3333 [Cronobacter muytjensii 530]